MIPINRNDYLRRLHGCWLGKAVGGTLGMPYEGGAVEGRPLLKDLTYYDPVPTGVVPNDDLDLQAVWLHVLRQHGLPVSRRFFARAWRDHIHYCPDEYAVCRRNLAYGLGPPLCGAHDNGFSDGLGATIRSEIWACLAPGDPGLAAELASEDACLDHSGEGIHGARFLAALQSAAFVEGDRDRLLDIALDFAPGASRLRACIMGARRLWAKHQDRAAAFAEFHATHGVENFTDAPMNLGIVLLGWLAGGGDFGRSICEAVNCGQDTDCTGASLGALLGILAPESIGSEWSEPIGEGLELSCGLVGVEAPRDLSGFAGQIAALVPAVQEYYGSKARLEPASSPAPPPAALPEQRLDPGSWRLVVGQHPPAGEGSLLSEAPLAISVHYPGGVRLAPGVEGMLLLRVTNTAPRPVEVRLAPRPAPNWEVAMAGGAPLRLPPGATGEAAMTRRCLATDWRPWASRLIVDLEIDGTAHQPLEAGLLTTLPFLVGGPGGWSPFEAGGFRIPLSALPGDCAAVELATEFKMPTDGTVRFVGQVEGGGAGAGLSLAVDGRTILTHDCRYAVPAIHRAHGSGSDLAVHAGSHRLAVRLEGLESRRGSLFLALGDPASWAWRESIEFRLPEEGA